MTNSKAALLRDMCERMRSDLVVAALIWLQLSWFGMPYGSEVKQQETQNIIRSSTAK